MKSIVQVITIGIIASVAVNLYGMDTPPQQQKSPRQEHACWILDSHWAPKAKIVLNVKKMERYGGQIVDTDPLKVSMIIAFVESAHFSCTNNTIDTIEFRLPEASNQISITHVNNFCKILKKNSGQTIAIYGAGNNPNVYLMLACAAIKGLINCLIKNMNNEENKKGHDSYIILMNENQKTTYKFKEIWGSDNIEILNLASNVVLNNIFSKLFAKYVHDSVPSCFSNDQVTFIRNFCLNNLTSPLNSQSSSGERIYVKKPKKTSQIPQINEEPQ